MTNKVLLLLAAATFSACSIFNNGSPSATQDIYDFSEGITQADLYTHLSVIASDSLEGRDTGSEGLKKAARYLSARYKELGLQPVGDDNSYYQHFDLVQPSLDEVSYTVTDLSTDEIIDQSTHSKTETGNFITLYGGTDTLSGPVAFVGAGIKNTEEGIDQYPEDLNGKWLMIYFDRQNTNMQFIQSAYAAGNALGVIVISNADSDDFLKEAKDRMSEFGKGTRMSLEYLQNKSSDRKSPAFNRIHPELAAQLLGIKNTEALDTLKERILKEPASFKARELDYRLTHEPVKNQNTITTKNVVALLEGSDPELKNEVVVLSSHYDHVGIGRADSTGDNIFNGADDDGSGTVATLATAQAMAEAKAAGVGPKRSVLFLHVSGEEKGLLGSRYYSDHPIYSIDNTIANINIDMIGRVDPEHAEKDSNYVYVIGGEIISSHLDSLIVGANAMGPNLTLSKRYNDLNDPNQFYRRSDHWNFGRLGVPFVFFFNGTHEDYHRQQDEVEKITFGPYLKRTQLVYNLTALLANSPDRPLVDNEAFIEKTKSQAR